MRYIISLVLTSLSLSLSPAAAQVPDVVTDIPPVHALVSQVMGDLGTPVLLLTKGASEHDFQLRPSQAQALADAELVVWIGPELTPWLDRALTSLSDARTLGLLDSPETLRRAFSADGAHVHAADATPDTDGDSHTGTDPHAWLDPSNARIWLGLIAANLSALDPANAATYAANAATARDAIDALDTRIAAVLAPVKDGRVVAYHDAYGYFAAHFGLSVTGSVALGDATAPGAAKLAALQDLLAGGSTGCIFPEAQHDAALPRQLAEATRLRLGTPLDPVGSTLTPGPQAYDTLLTTLASDIATCLAP